MAPPRRREEVERESFLQAFEKPTQIYRYLKTRNMVSPIFLHRNLNYMSQRMSRTHKGRATFKIDSLLAEKLKARKAACPCFGNHMTLMFQGYFDRFQNTTTTATGNATAATGITSNNNNNNNTATKPNAKIRLEVLLLKIAHKKRSPPSVQSIGVVEIPQNPPESQWDAHDIKFPTLSVNTELLDPADSPCRQMVVFRTTGIGTKDGSDTQQYSSELMLFDKTGRCLLTDGEYQLTLQESGTPPVVANGGSSGAATVENGAADAKANGNSPKKYASWENLSVFHSDSSGFEDQFEKNPMIKFQLQWTEQPYFGDFARLVEVKKEKEDESEDSKKQPKDLQESKKRSSYKKNVERTLSAHEIFNCPSADLRITFHFVHNNVSHQTTEETNSRDCPWCHLKCLSMYSLLKHLKLCHARFAFNFVHSGGNSARIEVSINELFDGSYAGAPNNYLTTPSAGYAFSRSGPVRRTVVTHVQVCRPRRLKPTLAEFTETDEAVEMNGTAPAGEIDRPYMTGHNRLYHHTMTCLPVNPRELDVDSEEESDPRWLKQKTMMMIDEFTDVNEGEKELMKMWNLHVMRHGFVGDCQTALACEMFVEQHGKEVLAKNLYRNFVVHMCSLFDYGLVASEAFHRVVQKLQKCLNESPQAKEVIYGARAAHREHWNTAGYLKFEQQQREEEERRKNEEQEQQKGKKKGGNAGDKKDQPVGDKRKTNRSSTSNGDTKEKPPTEGATNNAASTRSRDTFQKPKGGSGGQAATMDGKSTTTTGQTSLVNGAKKKTGNGGGGGATAGKPSGAGSVEKRKLDRESSPTRRRSADSSAMDSVEKRARLEVMRRKSIAVIESETNSVTGKTTSSTAVLLKSKSKTRLSLSLTGNLRTSKEAAKK